MSGALDAVGADIAVHVMGQHCFVDTALLADMLGFMGEKAPGSYRCRMPSRPISRARSTRRALLDDVATAIAALPDDRAIHYARYAAFVSSTAKSSRALTYEQVPHYDRDYLLKVREIAQRDIRRRPHACGCRRGQQDFQPVVRKLRIRAAQFGTTDRVLDIACGDGYGCRICAECRAVLGMDINEAA